ncbi:MAG: hypothetical protein ACP5K5_02335 [Candidatus Micrarchaeia archaeon]
MDRRSTEKRSVEENDSALNIYAEHDGKKYRVPYGMIKHVVFRNIKKSELVDLQHAARLQYRLMLMEPVIKATVSFVKSEISILYNPVGADNSKPKTSLEELKEFLKKEGINVDEKSIEEEDFDYRHFYTYAFSPKEVRDRPPYTYTQEEWRKMKPEVMKKKGESAKKKWERFLEWQKKYEEEHKDKL